MSEEPGGEKTSKVTPQRRKDWNQRRFVRLAVQMPVGQESIDAKSRDKNSWLKLAIIWLENDGDAFVEEHAKCCDRVEQRDLLKVEVRKRRLERRGGFGKGSVPGSCETPP